MSEIKSDKNFTNDNYNSNSFQNLFLCVLLVMWYGPSIIFVVPTMAMIVYSPQKILPHLKTVIKLLWNEVLGIYGKFNSGTSSIDSPQPQLPSSYNTFINFISQIPWRRTSVK
jgi:hypothetical protein